MWARAEVTLFQLLSGFRPELETLAGWKVCQCSSAEIVQDATERGLTPAVHSLTVTETGFQDQVLQGGVPVGPHSLAQDGLSCWLFTLSFPRTGTPEPAYHPSSFSFP